MIQLILLKSGFSMDISFVLGGDIKVKLTLRRLKAKSFCATDVLGIEKFICIT
jgi:hypothetical protein